MPLGNDLAVNKATQMSQVARAKEYHSSLGPTIEVNKYFVTSLSYDNY